MHADRLKSLLADGGIAPENVGRLSELCEKWFMDEASLTAYVLRSIFRRRPGFHFNRATTRMLIQHSPRSASDIISVQAVM